MADGTPALEYTGFTDRSFTLLKSAGVCARIAAIVFFLAMGASFMAAVIGYIMAFGVARHRDVVPWIVIASVYLFFFLLYPVAIIALFRFASSAKRYAQTRAPQAFDSALSCNKFFLIYTILIALFLVLLTTGTFTALLVMYLSNLH